MLSRGFRTTFFLAKFVLVSAFGIPTTVNGDESFCPDNAIVDLTDATRIGTGYLDQSSHFFPTEFVRDHKGCMCDIKPCVPLCPPLKNADRTEILGPEHFRNTSAELPSVFRTNLTREDDEDPFFEPEKWFHVLIWDPCISGLATFLEPDFYKKDEWYLLKNSSLFLPRKADPNRAFISWTRYCLRQRLNETVYTPRVCYVPKIVPPDVFKIAIYISGLLSVPFVLATMVIYSVLPELRNIHGSTFKCYLGCLLVTYIILAIDRIPESTQSTGTTCLILGFSIYFSFLACFLWLNIMCFEMWWRFGGYGSLRKGGELGDRKKFIRYSIYAWGTATVFTAICIGLEFSPSLPETLITPGFREGACWFSTKTAHGLFFLGPVGLTVACNICLFISTSIKLIQHKRNTQLQLNHADSRRHDDNKLMFSLYLKLFVIMGISWSTEIISDIWEEPKYLWHITDMVNALQGVLIFIIFVCKKKIWQSLQIRYKSFLQCDRRETTTLPKPNADCKRHSGRWANFTAVFNSCLSFKEKTNI